MTDQDELTPGEVARELNVSPATVYRWGLSGELTVSRQFPSGHRRYTRASVAALKLRMGAEQPDTQGDSDSPK